MFGSPEDAALIDEIVSLAYAQRRRPGKDQPYGLQLPLSSPVLRCCTIATCERSIRSGTG